jgi:hypothetical protein
MDQKKTSRVIPILIAAILTLSIHIFSASAQAQGGPPMLTDDPGTPGKGRWEVNFLATMLRSRSGGDFEAPNVDLNYGLGNHIQLKFEAPWMLRKETGERTIGGPGNSMAGIKWRFLDEERNGVAMSTYPQLEFNNPSRSAERGLVDKGMNLFLPIEAARRLGPVEVTGEIGYRIVQHHTDELEYGVLVARQISNRVELMAELHGSSLRTRREGELFFNAGSRLELSRLTVLLFSAGRSIRSPVHEGTQYIAAIGVQFNFTNKVFGALRKQ